MLKQSIITKLEKVLADSYSLYLKTQNFHWNVTGPHFYSLHKMFEEQYQDLASAIDEIAERIRILGAKVPASYAKFSLNTHITEGNENYDWQSMVKELSQDQDKMCATLKEGLTASQADGDETTADLMIK